MGRRGHGEGSIYQRQDGRWVGTLELGWENGKRRRKPVYGQTRREVADKLRTVQQRVKEGAPIPPERLTVGAFLNDWLVSVKGTVRPRTYERYESIVRRHLTPALGKKRLARLDPEDLDRFYADKVESGLSKMTVVHIHRVLHAALRQAARRGLVVRNVSDVVSPPRPDRKPMKTLTPEQASALIAAADGDRLRALYVLALTTGMRKGELLGLRWRDADLDGRSLRVQGSLQQIPGEGLKIVEPKTASSRRQIMLTETGVDALRRHRAEQAQERLRSGGTWEDHDMVFASTNGGPINPSNLSYRSFGPLLTKAKVPKVRFHDLRHTCATLLLGEGVHAKVVSEMLGHTEVGITLDLYSHVTPTMQKGAADALDGLLGDPLAVNLAVNQGLQPISPTDQKPTLDP